MLLYTQASSTFLYIYILKEAWSKNSDLANGVAVEGAGRSIRLGAEVEQRELSQSSRKAARERENRLRQRPSSEGGGLL